VREVYNDLRQKRENGEEPKLDPMDEHGFGEGEASNLTPQEQEALGKKIDRALREGGILASKLGSKTPRSIQDLLDGKVDWRAILKDFVMSTTRGKDEYTWRKFNKRHLADDIYLPSMENDRVGELIVAIDTSGSIGSKELSEFASELVQICETANPEKVRILWWDTEVHGEQVFTDGEYEQINTLLKPQGGGGTDPQCIPNYINDKKINAIGTIVFTDGYFYVDKLTWNISMETLWLVTENDRLEVPTGKIVKQEL